MKPTNKFRDGNTSLSIDGILLEFLRQEYSIIALELLDALVFDTKMLKCLLLIAC